MAESRAATVIAPSRGWVSVRLAELWHYRELLYFLTWRDVAIRYKQTVLGVAWAVIQPLFAMAIFTIFLGKLAKVPSEGIPYPVFCLAALVPWTYFANSLTVSSQSIVASSNLVTKVYFPRLLIPFAGVLSGLPDLGITFLVLTPMIFFFGLRPTAAILWLPAFVLLAVVMALGMGLWLSALNVRYRDVRYTIPFLTQLWLFATPVVYPSSLLPEPWKVAFGLNPMVGVVEGFRWSLLGTTAAPGATAVVSALVAIALLMTGCLYFWRTEKTFADIV